MSQPIETYDEFDRENAFGRVVFNFIEPGEDLVWISRSWKICCGRRSIRETGETVTTGYSKEDYGRSWSSLEWKSGLRRTIDQGNLRKLLGMRCNKLSLIMKNLFSTEMRIP